MLLGRTTHFLTFLVSRTTRLFFRPKSAALPSMRKIAISDIHGCAKTFKALVEDQIGLQSEDHLFLLGDYFSRGPDAEGVLAYIQLLKSRGQQIVCLMGNHEHRMLMRLKSGEIEVAQPFLDFIGTLVFYHELDDYLLIHAGLNCALPDPLLGLYDILYARQWEHQLDTGWLGKRQIVHGHERFGKAEIEKRLQEGAPVLAIDNGCSTPDAYDQGALCALDLGSKALFFQPNIDGKKAPKELYWQFGATLA